MERFSSRIDIFGELDEMTDKTLQLDLATLPTKYIALCEFTGNLMNKSAKDIDEQVELFLRLTNFEVNEMPIDNDKLNTSMFSGYDISMMGDINIRQFYDKQKIVRILKHKQEHT